MLKNFSLTKQILALSIVFCIAFVMAACSSDEAIKNATTTTQTTNTATDATTENIRETDDAKKAYLEKLQTDAPADSVIYNAYFFENKGSEPILAYGNIMEFDIFPTPEHVYHYIDGKVVETNFSSASGSAEKEDVFFVEGTHSMVYRCVGNTGGTLGYGLQEIYVYNKSTREYDKTSSEYTYNGNIVHNGDPNDSDYQTIQNDLYSQMDKDLKKAIGTDYELVSYSENMVTENTADYIEKALDGKIQAKNYIEKN